MRPKIEFKLNAEVELPKEMIYSVPEQGRADDAVEAILRDYDIKVTLEDSIKYLKRIGDWTVDELQDLEANKSRLVWLACLDCQEQDTNLWYMGG